MIINQGRHGPPKGFRAGWSCFKLLCSWTTTSEHAVDHLQRHHRRCAQKHRSTNSSLVLLFPLRPSTTCPVLFSINFLDDTVLYGTMNQTSLQKSLSVDRNPIVVIGHELTHSYPLFQASVYIKLQHPISSQPQRNGSS